MSLQYRLRGHTSPVTSLAYLTTQQPDLLSGDSQGQIRFWCSKDRRSHIVQSAGSSVISLNILPNSSQTCFSQCRDGSISLYNTSTFQLLYTMVEASSPYSFCRVALHEDGVRFAASGDDRKITVAEMWRTKAAHPSEQIQLPEDRGRCMSLCWIDEYNLAVGFDSGYISHWDLRNVSKASHELQLTKSPLFSIIWNPVLLAGIAGSSNRILKSWQYDERSEAIFPGPDLVMNSAGVNKLSLRSDNRLIGCCSWDQKAFIYTCKSRRIVGILDQNRDKITDISFSNPETGLISTACQDHTIAVYRL
jgi:WD40 repeat protein